MERQATVAGAWTNQNGSVLIVDHVDGGRFSGRFQSAKGRAARDRQYPVVGCQNGEILSFIVDFEDASENLHAMSSFSGRLTRSGEGAEQIHTVWVLTRQFEDEARTKPTQPWNSFLVNSDIFTRVLD